MIATTQAELRPRAEGREWSPSRTYRHGGCTARADQQAGRARDFYSAGLLQPERDIESTRAVPSPGQAFRPPFLARSTGLPPLPPTTSTGGTSPPRPEIALGMRERCAEEQQHALISPGYGPRLQVVTGRAAHEQRGAPDAGPLLRPGAGEDHPRKRMAGAHASPSRPTWKSIAWAGQAHRAAVQRPSARRWSSTMTYGGLLQQGLRRRALIGLTLLDIIFDRRRLTSRGP